MLQQEAESEERERIENKVVKVILRWPFCFHHTLFIMLKLLIVGSKSNAMKQKTSCLLLPFYVQIRLASNLIIFISTAFEISYNDMQKYLMISSNLSE